MPSFFIAAAFSAAMSTCCMIMLSVISSSSSSGAMPVSARIARDVAAAVAASLNCRGDRFTDITMLGRPRFCQAMFCSHAVRRTHLPIGDDEAGILGQRNELRRRHRAEIRVPPAQQRLRAENAARDDVDSRLILQRELARVAVPAQPHLELEVLDRHRTSCPPSRTGSCSCLLPWRDTSPCRRASSA